VVSGRAAYAKAVTTLTGREETMIRIGVIGYGYLGPNIVRNLHSLDSTRVAAVCDSDPKGQSRAKHAYPDVQVTSVGTHLKT
jgi:predicted homoserine dehydrogenase-like protein